MVYYKGTELTYLEVSEILGVSPATIAYALKYSRARGVKYENQLEYYFNKANSNRNDIIRCRKIFYSVEQVDLHTKKEIKEYVIQKYNLPDKFFTLKTKNHFMWQKLELLYGLNSRGLLWLINKDSRENSFTFLGKHYQGRASFLCVHRFKHAELLKVLGIYNYNLEHVLQLCEGVNGKGFIAKHEIKYKRGKNIVKEDNSVACSPTSLCV